MVAMRVNENRAALLINLIALALLYSEKDAVAHHSFAEFDMETRLVLEGTVERLRWTNPHVQLEIRDAEGVLWTIETDSPATMQDTGWNRDSYRAGEPVTVRYHPSRMPDKPAGVLYSVRGPDRVSRSSVNRTGVPKTITVQIVTWLSLVIAAGIAATWRRHRSNLAVATSGAGALTLLLILRFSFTFVGEVLGLAMLSVGVYLAFRSVSPSDTSSSEKP